MLGQLSMTVNECIEAYKDLANDVFGHPRLFHIYSLEANSIPLAQKLCLFEDFRSYAVYRILHDDSVGLGVKTMAHKACGTFNGLWGCGQFCT